MPTKTKPRTSTQPFSDIAENFRLNLPAARKAAGFTSQAKLAARLTELGYPINETAIARIELGERKISLDEAVLIAAVLGQQLCHLITPATDTSVRLAPSMRFSARKIRDWLRAPTDDRSRGPLRPGDFRLYWAGPHVPEAEMVDAFVDGATARAKAKGRGGSKERRIANKSPSVNRGPSARRRRN